MTFQDIYETIFSDIDEDIADYELLKKIKNYINRAYIQLAKKEQLDKIVTLKSTNNKFRIPSNSLKVITVTNENNPIKFSIEGRYIIADYDEIELKYAFVPDKLEYEDDETLTNESNVEFIINYAKWLYYLSDGLLDEAALFKKEYETMEIIKPLNNVVKVVDVLGVM